MSTKGKSSKALSRVVAPAAVATAAPAAKPAKAKAAAAPAGAAKRKSIGAAAAGAGAGGSAPAAAAASSSSAAAAVAAPQQRAGQKRKRAASAEGKRAGGKAAAAAAGAGAGGGNGSGAASGPFGAEPKPRYHDGSGADSSDATAKEKALLRLNVQEIGNKAKRQEMYRKQKEVKQRLQHKERTKRQKVVEALGADAPAVRKQRTLENTREADETVVNADANADDAEVVEDEKRDEFEDYFNATIHPKIILTTCYNPSKIMYDFIQDLMHVFPNSYYYERKKFEVKQIVEQATAKGFTDVIIINEDRKKLNGLTLIHLPNGPTAFFKLSSVVLARDIPDHAAMSSHKPEVMLNRFTTRLGHRVGRMLAALFHQDPNFKGRRVCTFHNQRDFIFFRQHRYDFDGANSQPRIQEMGPQFTLKLRWLQHGTFDTKHGAYEFMAKPEHDTTRRKFHL